MSRKATDAQTKGVEAWLKVDPRVKQFRFSGGAVYSEHMQIFTGSSEQPVQSVSTTQGAFRVTLSKPVNFAAVKQRYGLMPGVERLAPSG